MSSINDILAYIYNYSFIANFLKLSKDQDTDFAIFGVSLGALTNI